MSDFVSGLITMGYLVAGLFFLRYYWQARDGLFAIFAAAFWILAAEQGFISLAQIPREDRSLVYLLRLTAFILIIGAILVKNSRARRT